MDPITRGETKTYTVTIKNADGTLRDLATDKLYCTLRLRDVVTLEKKNTLAGGSDAEIQVTALGTAKLKFVHDDTKNMEPCLLDGDFWLRSATEEYVPVQKFVLQVTQAQTRLA